MTPLANKSSLGIALPLTLLATLFTQSCATISRGSRQEVSFDSIPSGATVRVADQSGVTPVSFQLQRGKNYEVQLEKDGYEPVVTSLERRRDLVWDTSPTYVPQGADGIGAATAVMALLLTTTGGLAIDWLTGAMYQIDPPAVTLHRSGEPDGTSPTQSHLEAEREEREGPLPPEKLRPIPQAE